MPILYSVFDFRTTIFLYSFTISYDFDVILSGTVAFIRIFETDKYMTYH